jgi:hypothetical protein
MSAYLLYIKLGAGIALLAGLYWFGWHGGAKHVQTRWDAAKLVQAGRDTDAALAYANATKAAKDAQDAATALNGRIENDLLPKLAGADARAAALTRMLHAATAAQSSHSPLPQGTNQLGSPATCGRPGSTPEIERLTAEARRSEAEAWAAGERDGTRLEGLIAEIKPQL